MTVLFIADEALVNCLQTVPHKIIPNGSKNKVTYNALHETLTKMKPC